VIRALPNSKQFRDLWDDLYTHTELAAAFNVHVSTVTRAADVYGYPERDPAAVRWASRARRAEARRACRVPLQVPAQISAEMSDDEAILATGGRYRAMAALAEVRGWPMAGLMQRYHRARAGRITAHTVYALRVARGALSGGA